MTSAPSTGSAFAPSTRSTHPRWGIPESIRRALLLCGVLSSLDYFVAMNFAGPLRWEGYSSMSQAVSELSAIDAPSRPTMVALFVMYSALVMAFGVGVRASAGSKRALRLTGGFLIAFGVLCLTGPLTPMHQRGAGGSVTDLLHIASTIGDVLLIILVIGSGAMAFGWRFRLYSIATIVVLFSFAALTGLSGPAIAANLPTPGAGLMERISIGAYLLWFAALAGRLLAGERSPPADR